jgi:hypothetical protein
LVASFLAFLLGKEDAGCNLLKRREPKGSGGGVTRQVVVIHA